MGHLTRIDRMGAASTRVSGLCRHVDTDVMRESSFPEISLRSFVFVGIVRHDFEPAPGRPAALPAPVKPGFGEVYEQDI